MVTASQIVLYCLPVLDHDLSVHIPFLSAKHQTCGQWIICNTHILAGLWFSSHSANLSISHRCWEVRPLLVRSLKKVEQCS